MGGGRGGGDSYRVSGALIPAATIPGLGWVPRICIFKIPQIILICTWV